MLTKTELKEVLSLSSREFSGIDPLEATIHLTSKYSFLPEIYDIFGKEKVLLFLEKFGGKSIKVPTLDSIEDSLMSLVFWDVIRRKGQHLDRAKNLANRYNMSEAQVMEKYRAVSKLLKEQNRRFKPKRAQKNNALIDKLPGSKDSIKLDGTMESGEELYGVE